MASQGTGALYEEIEALDSRIMAAAAGQEREVAVWLEQRRLAVERFATSNRSFNEVVEIRQRNHQIQQKLLHWRRSTVMELSLIEQQIRYAAEQRASDGDPASLHLNVRG